VDVNSMSAFFIASGPSFVTPPGLLSFRSFWKRKHFPSESSLSDRLIHPADRPWPLYHSAQNSQRGYLAGGGKAGVSSSAPGAGELRCSSVGHKQLSTMQAMCNKNQTFLFIFNMKAPAKGTGLRMEVLTRSC